MTINEFLILEVAEKRDRDRSSNIIDLSRGNLTEETFVCRGISSVSFLCAFSGIVFVVPVCTSFSVPRSSSPLTTRESIDVAS